jgi:perosamine synthetase
MIPIAEPYFDEQELANVVQAVKTGWVSSKGSFIPEFEERCAAYCGVRYGVATANGTCALHLALTVLGVGPGDEVIVPSLTFVATANAVRYAQAKPVFVDSDPYYWCLDPEKLEAKITRNTKAIIPVHLYGHPCDMDAIADCARRHNLYVIEDVAQAHGAEYKGKKVGSFGEIACFSFYGNKMITTGEGGMCLTDSQELAERMRLLRDHGMNPTRRYWHDFIGFNYRMTNMQAGIGVAQLGKLERFIERKRAIAGWYEDGLGELARKGLIKLHPEMPWAKGTYWMYSILTEDAFVSRDELAKRMEQAGVETRPFFHPMHTLPPYRDGESLPVCEELSAKGISLPSGVSLTREDVEMIVGQIGAADTTRSPVRSSAKRDR